METTRVGFDLPTLLVAEAGLNPYHINEEVRRALALFLYERRRIFLGKACELAGLSHHDFLDQGVSIFYSATDLEDDLRRLSDA